MALTLGAGALRHEVSSSAQSRQHRVPVVNNHIVDTHLVVKFLCPVLSSGSRRPQYSDLSHRAEIQILSVFCSPFHALQRQACAPQGTHRADGSLSEIAVASRKVPSECEFD